MSHSLRLPAFCGFSLFIAGALALPPHKAISTSLRQLTSVQQDTRATRQIIEPGINYEQQVREGQRYAYLLPLTAGHYYRLAIETGSVRLRIISAAGQRLVEKNGFQFLFGQSRVDLLPETSGVYTVELSQVSDKIDGVYALQLEEARPAREKDSLRLQARQIMDEVEALDWNRQPLAARRQSLPQLAAALPLWQASGDLLGEADGWSLLGALHFGVEPLQESVRYFNAALALYRQVGARREEGMVLYELARLYRDLNPKTALDYFEQALTVRRRLDQPRVVAHTSVTLGKFYDGLGESAKAFELFHQAAQLYRTSGDRTGLATVLQNLGGQSLNFGEQRRALGYYEEALALWSMAGSPKGAAIALLEIGKTHFLLGDYPRARESLLEGLKHLQEQGDSFNQVGAFARLGQVYLALGENQKALEALRQAIAANSFRPHEFYQMAPTFNHLCEAYAKLGEYDQAVAACRQALSQSEQAAYLPYSSIAQGLLAQIARRRSDLAQAQAHFETAIKQAESLRSRAALLAQRAALLGSKQHLYSDYIALLMERQRQQPDGGHARAALQISERARARSLLESLIEARADIRADVEPTLLAQEKSLQQQLDAKAAEQTRLLSSKHTEAQAAALAKTLAELTTGYERVQAEIRQRSPHYAVLTQPQPLGFAETQQLLLTDADTLLLEYALGEEQSFLFALSRNTFNVYELASRAEIEAATRRYYELLTARNQTIKFEEAGQRQQRIRQADRALAKAGAKLSQLILAPVAAELKNRHLLVVADGALQLLPFAALPAPVSERVGEWKSKRRGAMRPSLSRSPAPPLPHSPLIVNHVITYLPSASVLGVLRQELQDRQPAPKLLAVFADPVFEADDARLPLDVRERLARGRQPAAEKRPPAALAFATDELTRAMRDVGFIDERGGLARLPYTRSEANAILKFAPAAQRFRALDFAATQEAVLQTGLHRYRYVHFATHGLIDNAHPELSGLVLSRLDAQGRELDGYLRLVEIYNLRLPAELVVLSACKTGLGKEVRGEGLMSLTRGFLYAGAARVLVSLWDVNDKSTASLMGEFYRGLLQERLSPAAALRAAQLRMMKQPHWSAPYYWAAFTQHGEPR